MTPLRIGFPTLVFLLSGCRERAAPRVEKLEVADAKPAASASASPAASASVAPPEALPSGAPASSVLPPSGIALEKRELRDEKPAKNPSPATGEKACTVDAEYPVVRGIEPAVARRINAALEPKEAKLDPECERATSYEVRYTVVLNEAGLLSVVFDGNWCCGAHPAYSKRFVNLRVRDGKILTLKDLFRPGSARKIAARLHAMARKEFAKDDVLNDWLEEQTEEARDFSLERGGVRFSFFNAAPHAVQAAFQDGFLVACPELRGLGLVPGELDAICRRP